MSANEFLAKLRDGGAIVSSNACSEIEIANARATDRFFVDEDGFGYVWRIPLWLEIREDAYLRGVARKEVDLPNFVKDRVSES